MEQENIKTKIPNVPRSKNTQLLLAITGSTASAFASLLNPKYFQQGKHPTADHIVNLSLLTFHQMGYHEDARVFPTKGLNTSFKAREYWRLESRKYAEYLLSEAGMSNE